jgi:hypothetical protein
MPLFPAEELTVEFSSEEKMVIRRALSGYAQWCRDRAVECAQKTSTAPPESVGQAFAEEDRAKALHKRFMTASDAADENGK